MRYLFRLIDLPPLWLAFFAALAWGQGQFLPVLSFGNWANWLGAALIGAGIMTGAAAVAQFLRRRTTVIPRRSPSALVSDGIFRLTRNPIYLGDALLLGGLALRWESVIGLLLVPLFMGLIQRRFILGEELRLRQEFGAAFEAYAARVRRWL